MRTAVAGAVAAPRASAHGLRVNIAIALIIARPWSPRDIDKTLTMATPIFYPAYGAIARPQHLLRCNRCDFNSAARQVSAQRPISRAASAVSQNSMKEVMRPSRISMKSATSVSTTSPVAVDSSLTRPCTAALEPSIMIETMV